MAQHVDKYEKIFGAIPIEPKKKTPKHNNGDLAKP
jgi:hypothetical protein